MQFNALVHRFALIFVIDGNKLFFTPLALTRTIVSSVDIGP